MRINAKIATTKSHLCEARMVEQLVKTKRLFNSKQKLVKIIQLKTKSNDKKCQYYKMNPSSPLFLVVECQPDSNAEATILLALVNVASSIIALDIPLLADRSCTLNRPCSFYNSRNRTKDIPTLQD